MLWSQFSAIFGGKNGRFSQKPMLCSNLCTILHSFEFKRKFFRRKHLKSHNIGPWSHCSAAAFPDTLHTYICIAFYPSINRPEASSIGDVGRRRINLYMYLYMYIYMYICMYLYICIYTFVFIHMYLYICIYTYVFIHMYVFIYVYKYIYKCTLWASYKDRKLWSESVIHTMTNYALSPK
jgi:hypothetical protein